MIVTKTALAFMALLFVSLQFAHAQKSTKILRIGFLSSGSQDQFSQPYEAFLQSLRDRGYINGQNVMILARWAEGNPDRLKGLATELTRSPVDILVATGGTITALAAKNATTTIPIVFTAGGDLVKVGLIESLSHPGGNLTGLSLLTVEIGTKRL
jgi:putative ABC transport system substrate-binding protein